MLRQFPHCGHICRSLKGLCRCAFCLGTVVFFGAVAGGRDFGPSDAATDDEVSWVGGIIVPGLRLLENVEDFCGADKGGAATTISRDGLRSVRRRLECVASDARN